MDKDFSAEQNLPTNIQKHRLAQTVCCYAAFIATGLAAGLLGPTLVGLAKQTDSGFGEIGFVFTIHSLGYIVGSTVFGKLFDRIGGNKIFTLMIVLLSIALILIPLAPTLATLLGAAFLLGTAEGTGQVGVNTLLIWLYKKRSTPFLNGAHFCFGVGALTSPLIIAQVLNQGYEFGTAYRFVAGLIIPIVLLFSLVPSPEIEVKKESETVAQPIRYGLVVLIAAFYFVYLGTEISFGGWISAFAVNLKLSDEATAAYLASAFWSALTFGRLLAIALSLRLKPRTLLSGDLMFALVGFLLIGFGGNSFTTTLIGTLIVGVSLASVYPTMFSLAGNRLNVTGRVAGFFVMGGSLGSMIFPYLAGLLFEKSGGKSLIVLNLTTTVLALAALAIISISFPKLHEEKS